MIPLVVWLVGWVLVVYPLTMAIAADDVGAGDETSDKVFCASMAALLGVFWPFMLLGWGAYFLSRRIWRAATAADKVSHDD